MVLPGVTLESLFSHKNAWPIPEQRSDQCLLDLEPDLLRNLIHPTSKNTILVEQKLRTEAILAYSKKMILCGPERTAEHSSLQIRRQRSELLVRRNQGESQCAEQMVIGNGAADSCHPVVSVTDL